MARSRLRIPKSQRGLVLFMAAFTLFTGAIAYLFPGLPFTKWMEARNWEETPCLVESSRMTTQHTRGGSGSTKGLQIVYLYQFDGREYRGNRYSIVTGFLTGSWGVKPVLDRHPPGSRTVCYVNPANPSEALLDRGIPAFLLLGFFPVLFFLLGVLFFIGFTRQKLKER